MPRTCSSTSAATFGGSLARMSSPTDRLNASRGFVSIKRAIAALRFLANATPSPAATPRAFADTQRSKKSRSADFASADGTFFGTNVTPGKFSGSLRNLFRGDRSPSDVSAPNANATGTTHAITNNAKAFKDETPEKANAQTNTHKSSNSRQSFPRTEHRAPEKTHLHKI